MPIRGFEQFHGTLEAPFRVREFFGFGLGFRVRVQNFPGLGSGLGFRLCNSSHFFLSRFEGVWLRRVRGRRSLL